MAIREAAELLVRQFSEVTLLGGDAISVVARIDELDAEVDIVVNNAGDAGIPARRFLGYV